MYSFRISLIALCALFLSQGNAKLVVDDIQPKEFFCERDSGITLDDLNTLSPTVVKNEDELFETQNLAENYKNKFKGKFVIVDVSATWCPYCKVDMLYFKDIFSNKSITNNDLKNKAVQLHLTVERAHSSPKHDQSLAGVKNFHQSLYQRDNYMKDLTDLKDLFFHHLDPANFGNQKLSAYKSPTSGLSIFPTMTGFPYQLVFDGEGKLVFRGHFTNALESDANWTIPYNRHYEFLKELVFNGNCDPEKSGL